MKAVAEVLLGSLACTPKPEKAAQAGSCGIQSDSECREVLVATEATIVALAGLGCEDGTFGARTHAWLLSYLLAGREWEARVFSSFSRRTVERLGTAYEQRGAGAVCHQRRDHTPARFQTAKDIVRAAMLDGARRIPAELLKQRLDSGGVLAPSPRALRAWMRQIRSEQRRLRAYQRRGQRTAILPTRVWRPDAGGPASVRFVDEDLPVPAVWLRRAEQSLVVGDKVNVSAAIVNGRTVLAYKK